MRYKVVTVFLVLVLVGISTVTASAQNELSERDKRSIESIKETYRTAGLKNDKEAILSLFSKNASIYPNGLSPRKGIKAISDFWFAPGPSTTVIDEYEINIDEISGNKGLAFTTGSTKIKGTTSSNGGKESKRYASAGNYLTVFAKRNGEWKIIKHIWNGKFKEITK